MRRLLGAVAVLAIASAPAAAATTPASHVHIGDTEKQVAAILGKDPVLCTVKISDLCRTPVYLYAYVNGEPLGIGIQFHPVNGIERVSRVFSLGTIAGWKR